MIYMWFTGINYYKLAVEQDRDVYENQKHIQGNERLRWRGSSCKGVCARHYEITLEDNERDANLMCNGPL